VKKNILIFLVFLFSFNLFATQTSKDIWYGYFNKIKLSDKSSWWTEAQLRYDLDTQRKQQTLLRTGYLYSFNKNHELGLLYAFIETGVNREHRLAIQHVQKYGSLGQFKVSHRARLEHRSIEDGENLTERLRYLIRFQKEKITPHSWTPVVWNETFVNLSREVSTGNRHIDRNRLFLGYRYDYSKDLNVEVGYLNQYVPRTNNDSMEHILTLYLFM